MRLVSDNGINHCKLLPFSKILTNQVADHKLLGIGPVNWLSLRNKLANLPDPKFGIEPLREFCSAPKSLIFNELKQDGIVPVSKFAQIYNWSGQVKLQYEVGITQENLLLPR